MIGPLLDLLGLLEASCNVVWLFWLAEVVDEAENEAGYEDEDKVEGGKASVLDEFKSVWMLD